MIYYCHCRHAHKRLRADPDAGSRSNNSNSASNSNNNNMSALLSDPAALAAVMFGLNLLVGGLKKGLLRPEDPQTKAMAEPFVPLLRR